MNTFSAVTRLTFVAILFAGTARAAVENRIEARVFRALNGPVATGARVSLERVPVGDMNLTLELERFEVWAPNAQLVVDHGNGRRERTAPPAIRYFRGTVADDPDSMAFVAVSAEGAVDGMVIAHERRYTMRSRNADDVLIRETGFDEAADESFRCDIDGAVITRPGVPTVRLAEQQQGIVANGTLSGTGTWTLNLGIETDHELYTDLGSSAANVNIFIGNLVAQASVIYQRDLSTDLVIAFSRVQTSASDPFTIVPGASGTWNGSPATFSTSHALAELGDIWANGGTRPYNGPRSSVVLVSGKDQIAGVAWNGTACQGDFLCGSCGNALFTGHWGGGFAYLGLGNQATTTVPDPNNTNNSVQYGLPASNYWALLGFAHELGHNVDGLHTHCVSLTGAQKTQYGVTRNYIDECVTGCFAGPTSVPAEKGTIMSYCHMLGSSQSRFVFGKALETSELITGIIRDYINGQTPASPAISAPASVAIGVSTAASISSPVGGLTYDWTITNGAINGATQGTSINFTATADPATLRVRATNTSGCAASDYRHVAVVTCVAPALTSVSTSASIILGWTAELLATASGTSPSYQWYAGNPGDTSTPVGSGSQVNVTPGVNTIYWVRVTNSCGTADSGAVTITVTPQPSTSLYIVTPCRVLDTRSTSALANGARRTIQVTGACGIPSEAKAVVANITAVTPATTGFLAFFPAGVAWPGNSTLNYRTGKTRANSAILVLSSEGLVMAYNSGAGQHFIIDVTGYFQ